MPKGKKSEFPAYVKGQSCLQQGRKHSFVARSSGKGAICRNCGSAISQKSWEARNSKKND